MKKGLLTIAAICCFLVPACMDKNENVKGTLFIIGGGNRTDDMMNELVDLSQIRNDGYIYVLPMASSVAVSRKELVEFQHTFSYRLINRIERIFCVTHVNINYPCFFPEHSTALKGSGQFSAISIM